jgi:hypothetical protein
MIVTFGTTRRNYRELDSRQMSGLTVRLLWDQRRDTVIVQVHDWGGADLVLYPPKSQARYAFQHPFAVAHLYRVPTLGGHWPVTGWPQAAAA